MKSDAITAIFFWILSLAAMSFFAWVAVDELIHIQLDQEQEAIIEQYKL